MLTSLALILLLGLLLGELLKKLRLPALLGMILAGILLGPSALNLLDPVLLELSPQLRELALVIILTRAGLSLDLEALKRLGRSVLLMSLVPAAFEIGGAMLLAPALLGFSLAEAALLGAVLASISPAVIVPRMLKLVEEGYGGGKGIPQLVMAGTSVGDALVIAFFMTLVSAMASGHAGLMSFLEMPVSVVLGLALGIAVAFPLVWLFRRVQLSGFFRLLTVLGLSLLFLELESVLSGVLPVSAFLAIVGLAAALRKMDGLEAESLYRLYSKVWIPAEIVLFVLIGAVVNLDFISEAGLVALLVVLVALLFRMAGVVASLLKSGLNRREKVYCMFAYVPKATVQAAIGGVPLAMGLSCGHEVLMIAVLSILLTAPLGALLMDVSYRRLLQRDGPAS